jgi:hypothetical protein
LPQARHRASRTPQWKIAGKQLEAKIGLKSMLVQEVLRYPDKFGFGSCCGISFPVSMVPETATLRMAVANCKKVCVCFMRVTRLTLFRFDLAS